MWYSVKWVFRVLSFLHVITQTLSLENRLSCGLPKVKSSYIFQNGIDAKAGDWPWHADIFYLNAGRTDYACAGSILDENTILTASHCMYTLSGMISPTRVLVHVGRIRLHEASEYTQIHGVRDIILHPGFSSYSYRNDIALIKLSSNITMTKYVQPICLWTMDSKLDTIIDGTGFVAGFGLNEQDVVSDQLKQATLKVVDPFTCIESDRPAFSPHVTFNMFCGKGNPVAGACYGDRGGGLFLEVGGRWFVRGLHSFTPMRGNTGLCDPQKPTAYTDVAKYLDWISQYIDQRVLHYERDIDHAERLRLFNFQTCGVKSSTFVKGGLRWTLPWIGFVRAPNEFKSRCVVTLISEWYAVGPAPCFQYDGVELFVVLGSNNEHSKSECYDPNRAITCTQASQIRKIQREILHPKINRRNFAESISLIELQSPADISQPNVKPICLPVTPELKTNTKTNLHLAASSRTDNSFKTFPVRYVESDECTRQYAERKVLLDLENNKFCAELANKQDEQYCIALIQGAPLQEMKLFNGTERYFLRGLELRGFGCFSQPSPVYNNIESYLDWILYSMRYNEPMEIAEEESKPENETLQSKWTRLQQEPGNEKLRLFNMSSCGIPHIPNAENSSVFVNPWMVTVLGLEYSMNEDTQIQINNVGVLISEWYFLINAHLVSQKAWGREVYLGLYYLALQSECVGDSCKRPVRVSIQSITIHPNYAQDPLNHNIALVELAEPANLHNPDIRPICMPFFKELQNNKPLELIVSYTNNVEGVTSKNLPALNPFTCQRKLEQRGIFTSTKTVPWCVIDEDREGQSQLLNGGATLQGLMKFDQYVRYFLRGINLPNNIPYELPEHLQLFTNVDRFLDWIVDNMKFKEYKASPKTELFKVTEKRIKLPPIQGASHRRLFNFSNCGIMPLKNESSSSHPIIPWMGYLTSNITPNMPSKCAVTLISEWYAVGLTGCFSGDSLQYSILFGVNSVTTHTDCIDVATGCGAPTQRIPVRKVIIHPQYDRIDHRNDIALVQFARAVDTSQPNVKPICLPVLDEVRSFDISSLVQVRQNIDDTKFELSKAGNRHVESTECQKRWDSLAVKLPIENRKMCFLFEIAPNNECFDLLIGSSLQTIQIVGSKERHFLRGILAIKPNLCTLYFPLLYTDTDNHLNWILNNMEEQKKVSNPFGLPYDLREKLIFY